MITKKHFIRTALIVSQIKDQQTRREVALNFASWFKEDNPRFLPQKFVEACDPKAN